MNNSVQRVLNNRAIDATSRIVTDQAGCVDDWRATVKHLKELNEVLTARRNEIKNEIRREIGKFDHVLQLKMRNIYKQREASGLPVSAKIEEYMQLGHQVNRLNREYGRILKENGAEPSKSPKAHYRRKPVAAMQEISG